MVKRRTNLMQNIHILEVKSVVQKFFKPNTSDFIFFLDDSVFCPAENNPFMTDKHNVAVSLICFDCKSFKGFYQSDNGQKNMFCEGEFEIVVDIAPNVRDYLDRVEQAPELFWNQ